MKNILISNETPYRHAAPAPPHQTPGKALSPLPVGLVAVGVIHGDGLRARAHKGVLASAAGGRIQKRSCRHVDHVRGVTLRLSSESLAVGDWRRKFTKASSGEYGSVADVGSSNASSASGFNCEGTLSLFSQLLSLL